MRLKPLTSMLGRRQEMRAPGENARLDALRLIRSRRVGPATFYRLLAEYGSPASALEALPDIAKAAGINDYTPCPVGVIQAEMAAGRRAGAHLLTWLDSAYPEALREVSDAPPLLWVKGRLDVLEAPKIAVIGARNASALGLRMARSLAMGLGQAGLVTVAGLARGIDTVTHESSLGTGTIAVMAGGIDMIYPPENAKLADQICETGLIMTEQPPGLAPVARHFPMRNRIISGLSQAVVVVEAANRSGSLITARNALDQGREVLAVPGHPMDSRASGCNNLIRDGATLIRSAPDILTALGLSAPQHPVLHASTPPPPQPLPPLPAQNSDDDTTRQAQIRDMILSRLNLSPTDENALLRDIGLPPSEAAPALLSLELSGDINRMSGGLIQRS